MSQKPKEDFKEDFKESTMSWKAITNSLTSTRLTRENIISEEESRAETISKTSLRSRNGFFIAGFLILTLMILIVFALFSPLSNSNGSPKKGALSLYNSSYSTQLPGCDSNWTKEGSMLISCSSAITEFTLQPNSKGSVLFSVPNKVLSDKYTLTLQFSFSASSSQCLALNTYPIDGGANHFFICNNGTYYVFNDSLKAPLINGTVNLHQATTLKVVGDQSHQRMLVDDALVAQIDNDVSTQDAKIAITFQNIDLQKSQSISISLFAYHVDS